MDSAVMKKLMRAAMDAALEAVDPERVVDEWLAANPDAINGAAITVVAFGKAAPAMARASFARLGERVAAALVVSDHAEPMPPGCELIIAGHPRPNAESLRAGRRALELAGDASSVLYLVSGGGSALLESPAPPLTLDDVSDVTEMLLRSGAPITDMNVVRTHLSAIKGGRLAAAGPAAHVTLALSDVVGSPPHAIASGPTVPAVSTPRDAVAVLERWAARHEVPPAVIQLLHHGSVAPAATTGRYVVVGDGAVAAAAAARFLESAGHRATVVTTELAGEARDAASDVFGRTPAGTVGVFAGETTVTVTGDGVGGRNQEAALAFARIAAGLDAAALCVGTDGIDGPTDAAGAYVDGSSCEALRTAGIDPAAALAANDAHPALDAIGALIRTGPTGTNVGDLWLIWRG